MLLFNRGGRWKFFAAMFVSLAISGSFLFAQNDKSEEQKLQQASEQHVIVVTKAQTGPFRPRFRPNLQRVASVILKQTNDFRKKEKLEPLVPDETLQKTAQDFADYMATTGRYGHNADHQTPSERATAHGYEICFIGENIAMQFKANGFATGPLTKAFFQGWKNSPPHRANMLHPAVTQTGIGISQSPDTGAYFAVQLVGRPISQAINFQVTNQTKQDVNYRLGLEQFELPPRYTRRHQLCTPAELTLDVEDKEAPSVQPASGQLYSITTTDEGLEIETTEAKPDE